MKVFLGGTCNGSKWRSKLIESLSIEYFNPIVDNWDDEAKQRELEEREECDYCLYVITPLMAGLYSIAEAVDDSNKRPDKLLFCVLKEDYMLGVPVKFGSDSINSLIEVKNLITRNGAKCFNSLDEISSFLNSR